MRVFLLIVPWTLAAQTTTLDIRPTPSSRLALEVFKSKLWEGRRHTFVFDRFSGVLSFDPERPERSTVRFVIESGSARCIDDWVKPAQIKDIERAAVKDTLAATEYPEMAFQSTAITRMSPEQYEVQGMLTIRGRTRPVTLALNSSRREDGIWIEGSSRVKLSDFDLKPPRGVVGIRLLIGTKDEMNVIFGLLATKR